jgi:hypothetical protein
MPVGAGDGVAYGRHGMGVEVAGVSATEDFGMGVSGGGNGIRGRAGQPRRALAHARERERRGSDRRRAPCPRRPPSSARVGLAWLSGRAPGRNCERGVRYRFGFGPFRAVPIAGVFFREWFARAGGM